MGSEKPIGVLVVIFPLGVFNTTNPGSAVCGIIIRISYFPTLVGQIVDRETGKVYDFGTEAGPISKKLYELLKGIQLGTEPDTHNWNYIVE